ncbi:hypothetical protein ZIOFF_009322 [Zingiber officinale]|uniref:C2 NT-type domain-containing protein n=2 Tax=Zingiber officinale TaxID=94328 RepID=A0A8J5HXA5_ZINOF|nr:hypothetical protein ZIOFF_009322 [Zingiber officinale]
MMLRKPTTGGKGNPYGSSGGGGSGGGDLNGNVRFLHEIEALSKALSVDPKQPNRPRLLPSSSNSGRRSVSAGRSAASPVSSSSVSNKEKKKAGSSSSRWGWNPIKKALSHIGGHHRRFDCWFTLRVHSIDGLPPAFASAALIVHWRRTTDPVAAAVATRPARVVHGGVQFDETLTYLCPVSASRSGPGGTAKYEPRHFLIYPTLAGGASPDLDLGRHLVDLTRVLPSTLEELVDEKAIGKWSTSFRLSGKARGASLSVSFGFSLVESMSVDTGLQEKKISEMLNLKEVEFDLLNQKDPPTQMENQLQQGDRSGSVVDVKVLHEVLKSSNSETSLLVTQEKEAESENDAKHSTLDDDANPDFEIPHEQKHLAEVIVSESLEPSVGTMEEPQLQKSSISTENVKENDIQQQVEPEFTVIEQGTEIAFKYETHETSTEVEKISVKDKNEVQEVEYDKVGRLDVKLDKTFAETTEHDRHNPEEDMLPSVDQEIEDLESIFDNLSIFGAKEFESPTTQVEAIKQQSLGDIENLYERPSSLSRSRSLDVVTESVASEFLSMLGIEHSPFGLSSDSDPESPRERLWKQFEKEALASGDALFGLDTELESAAYWDEFPEDLDLSLVANEAEIEFQNTKLVMNDKSRAKMLEDAETEALMQEWGLHEKDFHSSPPGSRDGFGSPIHLPPEDPLELPPLGEGLGSILQTKDGGFLRSMNPSLFSNAKNNEDLVMQVSSPIVVPAEMGSGVMEILKQLASMGIEKLSRQASKLMPLNDITGKTMEQIAWDSSTALDSCERYDLLENHYPEVEANVSQNVYGRRKKLKGSAQPSCSRGETISEFVSLEDLAPMTMDKIEALSIEGLRIQSGMSDEEAPSNISSQSIGEFSALQGKESGKNCSIGLEGSAGLQLLNIKDNGDEIDGLMDLSLTLDEWMRLDAGIIDEDQVSDRTSRILAAHHANSMDLTAGGSKGDKRGGKRSGRKWGLLGNNFTVALMIQLRNPLRNYEPVGTPMLALIQVERVFVPPKPKIYSTISLLGNSEQEDETETEKKPLAEEKHVDEAIPQFKITEVHVAGLKSEPEPTKKNIWGNPKQQQSGSRWLLASGMGKSNKHPFMKSKSVVKPSVEMTSKVHQGDTLWSISSRDKWNDAAALKPRRRNPNIGLPS